MEIHNQWSRGTMTSFFRTFGIFDSMGIPKSTSMVRSSLNKVPCERSIFQVTTSMVESFFSDTAIRKGYYLESFYNKLDDQNYLSDYNLSLKLQPKN